jgi:2-dehydropantoate 2-reductase
MKVLVYGAGVIGSIFAFKLKSAGNDVTVLARGKRLEQLRKYGIVIEDKIFNENFRTDIKVIDRLRTDDYYDLVLIIMQRQQVSKILPVLQKNRKVPTFIFMGNSVDGAEEYLNFIDQKRIMLGFGGPGGYRKNNSVIAAYVRDYCILYFGEIDGKISNRVEYIKDVFQKSEIKVEIPESIDAWLKNHAALISPLAIASYAERGRGRRLVDEDKNMAMAVKAFKENLKALEKLGIPIMPKKFKMMRFIPSYFLKRKLKNLVNSEFGKIALSGHANHAKGEMEKITRDFRELVRGVKTDMSANDYLYGELTGKIKTWVD